MNFVFLFVIFASSYRSGEILDSFDEKLVLSRLQEEAEDHVDHG